MIDKLIINADDFGMSEGTTIGILLAHQKGIVTSTTCMMNMPFTNIALQEAKKYPNLGVGVHLVLTVGKPLIEGFQSFTDKNGNFLRPSDYSDGNPHADLNELYKEWKAQIEKFINITGHKPTHIDSHHHVHLLPWHMKVVEKLAMEYQLPLRQEQQFVNHCEYVACDITFYNKNVDIEYLKKVMEKHNGTLEIMCHPALIDQRLYDMSSYHLLRMKELDILRSQEIKDFIKEHHIELINYSQIKTSKP